MAAISLPARLLGGARWLASSRLGRLALIALPLAGIMHWYDLRHADPVPAVPVHVAPAPDRAAARRQPAHHHHVEIDPSKPAGDRVQVHPRSAPDASETPARVGAPRAVHRHRAPAPRHQAASQPSDSAADDLNHAELQAIGPTP